jgi:hypothetical protein
MIHQMIDRQIAKRLTNRRANFLFPLLLLFLLSSCGVFKNAGITKRHYRPGYSISSNSVKAVPVKNVVNSDSNENKKSISGREAVLTEVQKNESPSNTESRSPTLVRSHLNNVKAIALGRVKNITDKVKDVTGAPIHKVKSVLKPKKVISANAKKVVTEGKTYSLSTVLFVVGAILIIWGLSVLFGSIAMMSADIALALTIIIGLALVIVWGLIVLMVKSWFNGTNSK